MGVYEPCRCGLPMDAGADVADAPDVVDVPPRDVPPLVLPARLLLPRSVSRATTQRPTFRWVLPTGVTRARLTLARDRALTLSPRAASVEGDRWRTTEALSPGVWFWRVEGLDADGGVSWTSPTWEFFSPRRDSPVDSSWGTSWDFNGDGYDDLLANVQQGWAVFPGGASGLDLTHPRRQEDIGPTDLGSSDADTIAVGDFNGDGISDLIANVNMPRIDGERSHLRVYYGAPSGIETVPRQVFGAALFDPRDRDGLFGRTQATDWDGDGFMDMVVSFACTSCSPYPAVEFQVHRGGPDGVAMSPTYQFRRSRAEGYSSTGYLRALGDMDGDGYGDVAVATYVAYPGSFTFVYGAPADAPAEAVHQVTLPLIDDRYGLGAAGLGDMDGDGALEVAVGGLNRVSIFSGRFEAAAAPRAVIPAPHIPSSRFLNNAFGTRFAQPCDVNGDGLSDAVLGSPTPVIDGRATSGRVYVFWGRATGWSTTPDLTLAPPGTENEVIEFGNAIETGADANGDGFDDVFVAGGTSAVWWWGWFGGTAPLPATPPILVRRTLGAYFDLYQIAASGGAFRGSHG
ncbi:MAG: VCBS repeat-containing protein [Polyangiales bacterium]